MITAQRKGKFKHNRYTTLFSIDRYYIGSVQYVLVGRFN